ncbi:MAG TPA: immunoglobulin domain-containing protein [Patescibacteria group bacterium]|nr:immunoglobulin domain-containing protein [Patescibacteria group bacterium]
MLKHLPLIFILNVLCDAVAYSQVFTPGNLAVLRIGDGTQTLVNSGNTLFVDQYTPTGTRVSSVKLPDTGTDALLTSGTAGSEGGLTRSMDRSQLVIAGYNTNRGSVTGSLSSQSAAAVPRAVSTLDAFGTYHLAEASTILYSSNNIRGATSDGTNRFWTAGNPGGTYFLQPPQAPVDVETGGGNTRQVKIFQGTLYFSTQAGTAGIAEFQGGGLVTSPTAPVLILATGANSQPAGFALNPASTIAYVADQRPNAGGIQKWTNNGSAWSLAYSFSTGAGAFDVAMDFSGSAPVIYATTGEASGNRLISITDSGPLSIVKVLATAPSNEIFRGLAFAPDLRPTIVGQPTSQTVTNGANVSFSVLAQSRYPLSYQWEKNSVALSGATDSSITLLGVSSTDQGTYQVVVTNQYGSVTSSGANLTVTTVLAPPSITSQPVDQTIALGGTVTFKVTATGTAPLTYQWFFNGAELSGQTNASLVIASASVADQGNYLVHVTNNGGSTNSQAAVLTVVSPPPSYVPYTAAGSTYVQNFNSLPNPGTASVNANNPVTIAGVTYGLANPFDFTFPILPNSVNPSTGTGVGGLGLSNSMPGWYGGGELAPKFGASPGDQSTGGIISFGLTNSLNASTNRALGLLATSSTGATAFGLKLVNQTASTLGQITLSFTGELWRQAAVPKLLAFSYWIDPTGTNSLATNQTAQLPALNVSFPADPGATNPVPVDGTGPANQIHLGVTDQPIADWPPGAALWLTWQMTDATGKGQGLAIDDLVFSAAVGQVVPPAQLSIQRSGSTVIISWPAALSNYQLQSSPDLSQPGNWAAVSQPVIVNNGQNTVTVPIGSTQFFRLKQ